VGRLRPRSARGRLQTKPERLLFSVILVTHPKSYTETTDRRDFGSKPSKWRWGRVLSSKNQEFYNVGGARSKNSNFRVLGYILVWVKLFPVGCAQDSRDGERWSWERIECGKLYTATLRSAGVFGSAARGASAPTEGGEGRGILWPPPAYSLLYYTVIRVRFL